MPALALTIMRQLVDAAQQNQPQIPWDKILLVHADFDMEGQFARCAGVGAGATALRSAVAGNQSAPGIVLVGLLPEAEFRLVAENFPGADPVLNWPGFRYLRMPFSAEGLRREVETALNGRSAPVPLPTVGEVLTSIASVLHWLERVRQGQAGTARILADVARGEFELPRRNLDPEACLSPRQRVGLRRLCESLSLAIGLDNGREMADLLHFDLIAVDEASQRLEQLKAAYHSSEKMPSAEGLQMLAEEAKSLAAKATALFERVRYVEAQIVERAAYHND